MMLRIKYQGTFRLVSDKKIFKDFPIYLYVKQLTPGRGQFRPEGHNLNNLSRGPLDNATHPISKIYALRFRQ